MHAPIASLRREARTGALLVLAAAVAWSTGGVFARLVDLDGWTATAGRSIASAIIIYLLLDHIEGPGARRNLLKIGRIGWFSAVCGAIAMNAFILSISHTTIANMSIIYATAPFIAAAIAWVALKERPSMRTAVCSLVALVGVGVIVQGSLGGGKLLGDALALVMTVAFAVQIVIVRGHRTLPMASVTFFTCVISAVTALPFASLGSVDPQGWALLAAFGFVSTVLAFLLFIEGARRIPAAEAGLIASIEAVLGPLWVFLLFAEDPGLPAIIGGSIVMAAVIYHLAAEYRGPFRFSRPPDP